MVNIPRKNHGGGFVNKRKENWGGGAFLSGGGNIASITLLYLTNMVGFDWVSLYNQKIG